MMSGNIHPLAAGVQSSAQDARQQYEATNLPF